MNQRNILAIGVTPEEFNRVAPFLARDSFDVDRFPSGAYSFELTSEIRFEALLVRYPLPDMDLSDFLSRIRREESPNLRSSIVLVTDYAKVEAAEQFIGKGANRVVSLEEADAKIQKLVSGLLNVAPRKAARFMARMEIKIGDGAKDMIICQTENLSSSGMLLHTDKQYAKGTKIQFEFQLPNDHRPIAGLAEIVRSTTIGHEQHAGLGVRFISFAGDSQRRFQAYIMGL